MPSESGATRPDGLLARAGRALFRARGYTPIPFVTLLVLDARVTPPHVAVGGALLTLGESLRLWGVAHAGSGTRSRKIGASTLVTSGPYAHTRNPLYAGNLLMAAGYVVMANAWFPWSLLAALVGFVFQYALIIRLEEAHLDGRFGDGYRAYRAAVPRFGLRLTPYPSAPRKRPGLAIAFASERRTFQTMLILLAALGLRALWARGGGQ